MKLYQLGALKDLTLITDLALSSENKKIGYGFGIWFLGLFTLKGKLLQFETEGKAREQNRENRG